MSGPDATIYLLAAEIGKFKWVYAKNFPFFAPSSYEKSLKLRI